MGFKTSELTPLNTTQISPTMTPGKDVQVRAFKVARTDTTGTAKLALPADASILDFHISGVASDAATTATLSLGSTSTANEYVNAQDVKGGGTFIRPTVIGTAAAIDGVENTPLGADKVIFAKYAETGTASTVGGWTVVVYFVR